MTLPQITVDEALHFLGRYMTDARVVEAGVVLEKAMQRAWMDGFVAGLREYAWWKDGTQYVGSCGTTLEKAIERAQRYGE